MKRKWIELGFGSEAQVIARLRQQASRGIYVLIRDDDAAHTGSSWFATILAENPDTGGIEAEYEESGGTVSASILVTVS